MDISLVRTKAQIMRLNIRNVEKIQSVLVHTASCVMYTKLTS